MIITVTRYISYIILAAHSSIALAVSVVASHRGRRREDVHLSTVGCREVVFVGRVHGPVRINGSVGERDALTTRLRSDKPSSSPPSLNEKNILAPQDVSEGIQQEPPILCLSLCLPPYLRPSGTLSVLSACRVGRPSPSCRALVVKKKYSKNHQSTPSPPAGSQEIRDHEVREEAAIITDYYDV